MKQNRLFAIIYRIFSFCIIMSGIIIGSGFNHGLTRFLYYTAQSNILILIFFAYLTIRTLTDLFKKGIHGNASYSPRIQMALTLTIFFTLCIFWLALAPFAKGANLWSYGNLCLHTFAPLLAIFDYLYFSSKGHLKKHDAWLCALIPLAYVIEITILGFSGIVFYVKDGVNYFFPYIFMDYYNAGIYVYLFLILISSAFIGIAFLIIHLDKKLSKLNTSNDYTKENL